MLWTYSNRGDPKACRIADRHYSRQKIGSKQCAPPGRCIVLYSETKTGKAYWITSYPYPEYVKHAWGGAWICAAFRNEGAGLASELITQAIACSIGLMGLPPSLGMISFVDKDKVRPTMVRGKKTWGYVFLKAGFQLVGESKGGLLTFQILPKDMPAPSWPITSFEMNNL